MIKAISYWSFNIYKHRSKDFSLLAGERIYNSMINPVLLVQTWLIDLIYDLIKYNKYGKKDISINEALKLINLYNDYLNHKEQCNYHKRDTMLYVYGFFGEQLRFQSNTFFEEFAREKYILEKISKYPDTNIYNIDVESEFKEETSFSTDVYSANIFLIFLFFCIKPNNINKQLIYNTCKGLHISYDDIIKIIEKNSISLYDIRKHPLGRQVLYTKPIIKMNNEYIAANPFLMLALFANSNYWILRNKYCKMKSQNFINAFGIYFEKYVEELLGCCVGKNDYIKIPESQTKKRADWKISIAGFNILVEQKSTLPVLGIKQNQPDIDAIKKHIIKAWGEAVEQLSETEKYYNINNCIKIILVYDEYFKAESLEELFKLRPDLKNDGNYWLLNIREFEMLMMLYQNDKPLFKIIMNEKIQSETTFSRDGRELCFFLQKHNITHNDYLTKYGIYDEAERIKKYYICKGDKK